MSHISSASSHDGEQSQRGSGAYRDLFCQAIFLAFGASNLAAVARELHLSRAEAAVLFRSIVPRQPDSFFSWIAANPVLAEAWAIEMADENTTGRSDRGRAAL